MNEELLEAQKVRDKLYEKDLVYRALVDNYVKSGITGNPEALNALATYTNELQDKHRLDFFKQLDFTYEDLANMSKEKVISNQTILDMIEWKYRKR